MKVLLTLMCCFVLGSLVSVTHPFNHADPSNTEDDTSFGQHVELGDVHWHRDFEKAKAVAKSTGKPLFVLFQEIPGCQTCQDYGNQPMSHPLIVEAIEDLFVPVAVFNNKTGVDEQILKRFGEPSWNNPVVRFLNHSETDIVSRKDRIWSVEGTVQRMIEALNAAGKSVPDYLRLIHPPSPKVTETAEFAMHCYWEGEAKLGSIVGVHSTRAGWRDGLEVVQVTYSPTVVEYKKLLDNAQSFDCATRIFAHNDQQYQIAQKAVGSKAAKVSGKMRDAKASDQKYYLSNSVYRHLPLTELQATKVNSLTKKRVSVDRVLSPRQVKLLKGVQLATSKDNNSLKDFVYRSDRDQLGAYQRKLTAHLAKIAANQPN